jgi:hypothetical protein
MSSLIKAVILILSLNSQANWEDWNTTDKRLFKAYIAGTTLDFMQTKNSVVKTDAYIENNPFLGENPSADRILLQKLLSATIIYKVFNDIPSSERRTGLLLINGIQWGVVIKNESIGATFRYSW